MATNQTDLYDGALEQLTAAAVNMLKFLGDFSNNIEVGDLISEGWIRSVRYADDDRKRQWQPYYLPRHLYQEYKRITRPWTRTKNRRLGSKLQLDDSIDVADSVDYAGCYDLWESIEVLCTLQEREIIGMRASGMTLGEIGHQLGFSGERVRQKLERARLRLQAGGINYGQRSN